MVGCPEEADLQRQGLSESTVSFLRQLGERHVKADLAENLPNASEQMLDLLAKLLCFDPSERISVRCLPAVNVLFSQLVLVQQAAEALEHELFDDYRETEAEASSTDCVTEVEQLAGNITSRNHLQQLILREIERFRNPIKHVHDSVFTLLYHLGDDIADGELEECGLADDGWDFCPLVSLA